LTSKLTNNPNRYTKIMDALGFDSSLIADFVENLYNSEESIDSWLSLPENEEYREIGKASLALLLLDCESIIPKRSDDSLYSILYRNHLKTKKIEDFSDYNKNISFITFNYDRTLEHYLFTVLSAKHPSLIEKVMEELNKLKILHVYNSFGNLPWQAEVDTIPYFSLWDHTLKRDRPDKFDPFAISGDVRKASENIELMFGDELTPQFEEARKILKSSDKIIFMGFGYWDDNLKKLGFDYDTPWRGKMIRGTAYNVPDARIRQISEFTNEILKKENLINAKCHEFIKTIEVEVRKL